MASDTLSPFATQGISVGGKTTHGAQSGGQGAGRPKIGSRQVNTRVSDSLVRELEYVAEGLGLDTSSLIRMIITENLHTYRTRVDQRLGGSASEPGPT